MNLTIEELIELLSNKFDNKDDLAIPEEEILQYLNNVSSQE